MKKNVLLLLILNSFYCSFGQTPIIEGDLMLCPDTEGTATVTNQTYDSYQWYSKYWYTTDEYVAIPGAIDASFTYDWYTYDQSLFKVVVTLGTETLESNAIQIDSYNWASFVVVTEMNEYVTQSLENGHFMLCPGGSFTSTIGSPYSTNMQWYKDGIALPGENQGTYVISEPGIYYAQAAPGVCPNSISNNQSDPLIVDIDAECTLGTTNPIKLKEALRLYPNPVEQLLQLDVNSNTKITRYRIIDTTRKVLLENNASFEKNTFIDVSKLANGVYILILESDAGPAVRKFIKK